MQRNGYTYKNQDTSPKSTYSKKPKTGSIDINEVIMLANHTIIRQFFPVFLLAVCFIMPVQIYLIGGDLGIGLQGACYRYQITVYGNSFILISQDVNYIVTGLYGGRTAISGVVWVGSVITLFFGTMIALIPDVADKNTRATIICSLTFLTGIGFLLALIIQYGYFLNGPSGTSLPVGIPLLLVFSLYGYLNKETFF